MSARPTPLDTRIPPPVVMLLVGAMMWGLARLVPQFAFDWALQWPLAALFAVTGLVFEVLPGLRFSRAGTTVNPMRPQTSAHLVVDGLSRYSRNPMYFGQMMILLAWSVVLGNAAAILLLPLFPLYITRFQILPEERALAARFGDDYAAYRARVRRWL